MSKPVSLRSVARLYTRSFKKMADHTVAIFEWIAKSERRGTLEQDFVRAQVAFDSLPRRRMRVRRKKEPT